MQAIKLIASTLTYPASPSQIVSPGATVPGATRRTIRGSDGRSPQMSSQLDRLEARLGSTWSSIRRAQEASRERRAELTQFFAHRDSPDTSLVVFGSVAREEVTSGSDLDWILLIEGPSVPEHKEQEREIKRQLIERDLLAPGASGVFGCMVESHDLVHKIGGEDDLNSNTTRRVLLLLESYPVGDREAYDRVRQEIVRRYLGDDRGLTHGSSDVRSRVSC